MIQIQTILTNLLRHITCLVLSLCIALHAYAATEFKIITLQHRFAEEILPVIQPLVGNDGVATAMQNNLIIRTSPENMAEIERMITALDTARQNLKITVSRQSNTAQNTDSIGARGRTRIGNVTAETNDYPERAKDGVQINLENRQSSNNSSSHQFIQVLDGQDAFILVGQSIPYTQEWITLTHRHLTRQRTTEFIEIDTGFAVRPRSIGNQLELAITPRFSHLNQNGYIDFDSLTTVVRINRGDWLDLGGIMQQKDEVSRMILNWQHQQSSLNNQLFIRVE